MQGPRKGRRFTNIDTGKWKLGVSDLVCMDVKKQSHRLTLDSGGSRKALLMQAWLRRRTALFAQPFVVRLELRDIPYISSTEDMQVWRYLLNDALLGNRIISH